MKNNDCIFAHMYNVKQQHTHTCADEQIVLKVQIVNVILFYLSILT